jgi:hypothetical protein
MIEKKKIIKKQTKKTIISKLKWKIKKLLKGEIEKKKLFNKRPPKN